MLLKELKIRGLVTRTLIVTPANLSFQWQREMKDKFREQFEVIRSDVLRANYGSNPWQEKNQVITSVSWVSRIEDAKDSLLRSHWDLIIVDEAHKMSAYSADKKTLAYKLGLERLFRDMYARRIRGPDIEARIVRDIDANRFRAITNATLGGLRSARSHSRPTNTRPPNDSSGITGSMRSSTAPSRLRYIRFKIRCVWDGSRW